MVINEGISVIITSDNYDSWMSEGISVFKEPYVVYLFCTANWLFYILHVKDFEIEMRKEKIVIEAHNLIIRNKPGHY